MGLGGHSVLMRVYLQGCQMEQAAKGWSPWGRLGSELWNVPVQ